MSVRSKIYVAVAVAIAAVFFLTSSEGLNSGSGFGPGWTCKIYKGFEYCPASD